MGGGFGSRPAADAMPLTAAAPTSDEIFAASRLKWQKLRVLQPSDLDEPVNQAIAYVIAVTGRYFSDWPVPLSIPSPEPLLAHLDLAPLARQAVQLRVEQIVKQAQPGYLDTANDDLIQSMSVGGYSETRRDTASLRGGRNAQRPLLNSNPPLNALLETLMTEERYEFWLYRLQGTAPPAFAVQQVAWSLLGSRRAGYGLGDPVVDPVVDPYAPWMMWD